MKKMLIFIGLFSVSFFTLQNLSGFVLTMWYIPDTTWNDIPAESYVEFGNPSYLPTIFVALLALATATGTTKLISKRKVQ